MRELVGQGKPFYSSLDKAAGLLRRKVGTGSEFLKELMSIPGVKQAEVAERGLGELLNAPKMTHEQFMAALGTKPAPAIGEKVLGGDPDDPNWIGPYHYTYTLPGGENYREMLIKAPKGVNNQEKIMELEAKLRRIPMFNSTPEQQAQIATYYNQVRDLKAQEAASPKPFQGVSAHFGGEPGILASMRLKDRTGPNGEKLLHLEELQSDWHQQGREKGYRGEQKKTDWDDPEYVAARKRAMELGNEFNRNSGRPDLQAEIEPLLEEANRVERSFADINNKFGNAVPNAPFKKNWEEMALKRLIHHAAEKGYHGVVVTPGAEQADRYSLAKHISGVDYIRNELKPQRNEMIAYDPYGNVIFNEFGVTPEKLQEHIGKEAAEKLLSQEAQPNNNGLPTHSLRGEQLVVGGEGMKGFYDKKVPNILNGIGKKYGVKTELGGHPIETGRNEMVDGFAGHGQMKSDKPVFAQAHYFPITEEMRQDVKKNGIPLYKFGGTVSTY